MHNWKPTTDNATRKLRAQMLHDIRAFFYERKVLEVETPALSQAANTDPYIESFKVYDVCNIKGAKTTPRYLHTSPEYPMKRLLAADSGDIYQISKVWRSGESGTHHNPEFTLLEWYRLGFSYLQLIKEVDNLLGEIFLESIRDFNPNSLIVSYQQLFLEKFNFNPHTVSLEELIACCESNIKGLATDTLNHQDLLDALLSLCIEPEFDSNRLTFVIDYPASQSALAMTEPVKQTGYNKALRFEVYFGKLELGNGYQEETSYTNNAKILQTENDKRKQRNQIQLPTDSLFLDAIKAGLPACSGIAIGLDRVLMAISDKSSIKQVINFPWDRA